MVRQLMAAAVIAACVGAQVFAGPDGNSPAKELNRFAERPAHASTELTLTALHRVIDLKLNETPLVAAIGWLRSRVGVPLSVNWKSLEAAGISRREPVSLDLRNVHAATALDLLLRVASPEGPRLGWTSNEGVITISTVEDLNKNVVVQVYDIRDLLPQNAPGGEHEKKANALIKFIAARIDPASWRQHGGPAGAMRELQGQLIVTQTPQNHRAIIDLLQGLRTLRNAE